MPNESRCALVQTLGVSPIQNVSTAGMVRHTESVLTVPKSTDRGPPGTEGRFLGSPLSWKEEHSPELQVEFETRSVTEGVGSDANTTTRALSLAPSPRTRTKVCPGPTPLTSLAEERTGSTVATSWSPEIQPTAGT